MKILTIFALFIASHTATNAQITIPNGNFQFDFPNGKWKYLETLDVDEQTHLYLYSGSPVVSKDNDTTLPFMRIYVKNNIGKKNSLDYAMERFLQQPFMIVDEFSTSPLLPCKDAIGYIGLYSDEGNQKNKFYMIYFVNKGALVELRLETTEETFESKKSDFEDILKTITLK
ncbi:MAG: hypothetical protein IKX51_02570 [Bacteroidales bacterium]|nr:hypothetical protein [Bacteroidales bacterium]